jgi:hypothetical protein
MRPFETTQILRFLEIFIVLRRSHINAAFQFMKNICNFQIFLIFVNLIIFQIILLSQAFIVSNTGKSCHIFENIRKILNFVYL